MANGRNLLLRALIFNLFFRVCHCYKDEYAGLLFVPTTIPTTETEIYLEGNNIHEIKQGDFNDKFPNLTRLEL
jgi:hypothetical protein